MTKRDPIDGSVKASDVIAGNAKMQRNTLQRPASDMNGVSNRPKRKFSYETL
jgi:hypothetical protein